MRIFRDLEGVEIIRNPVVTTGSFDGMHLGHMTIIQRLNQLAREMDGESVLITFHPHPRKVLYPDTAGKDLLLINSQQEKIELLERAGLDNLIIITFTLEFSKTTSIDFIRKILVGRLNAKCIIVGFNHHFGHNREGSFEYLYELGRYYGFKVEEIPEQDIENETVSSTRIRKSLLEGKIQRANAYLNHLYMIIGPLSLGSSFLREAGFPTYEVIIEEDVKLIPATGNYAVQVETDRRTIKGMLLIHEISVRYDESGKKKVEVHFLDHVKDLIGKEARVFFHKQIREGYHDSDPVEFIKILQRDKAFVDELIY